MTDSTPPPDDQFLSDVLDGRAKADAADQVQGDPMASARLTQLRQARDLVATPVPALSDHQIDELVKHKEGELLEV